MPEKYRYDAQYKKLYEWDDDQQAYLFACSNFLDLPESELIAEYERSEYDMVDSTFHYID